MDSIYCSDDEYKDLAQNVDEMVRHAENLSHSEAKELVFSLLQSLDLLHREGLSRLMSLVDDEQPELKEKMEKDFAIKTLFGLYDLLEHEMMNKENAQPNETFQPTGGTGSFRDSKKPIWMPGGNIHKMQNKQLYGQDFEGEKVLLCKVDDEIFVVQNSCLDSILPLEFGKIDGHQIVCPWHECRYDLRSGELQANPDVKLATYPVRMEDGGDFKIGFNIN